MWQTSLQAILHVIAQSTEQSVDQSLWRKISYKIGKTKVKSLSTQILAVQKSHCLAFPGPSFGTASYPDQVVSFATQLRRPGPTTDKRKV
jgi:hypothetical protein